MLGNRRGSDVSQRRGGHASSLSVTNAVCCLNFVTVVACITYSTLAVAASTEAAGNRNGEVATAHSKTLLKKQDALCDVSCAAENLSTTQEKLRNRGCLVSLSATDKLRTQKNFSFVDVRSPAEFDRYRIAGSINIPLPIVNTKEFLNKLLVALLSDGRNAPTSLNDQLQGGICV